MFNVVRRFVSGRFMPGRFIPELILSGLTLLVLSTAAVAGTPNNIRRPVPRNTIGKSGSGIYRGHRVNYLVVNGRMMMDGDIVLEHVDQILPGKNYHPGGTLDYRQYLWTQVGGVYQIPYMIDPASGDVSNINAAISRAAHAKCTFTVTFTPSAVGTRTSAVTVTDAANPGVQTLNVSGTGQ